MKRKIILSVVAACVVVGAAGCETVQTTNPGAIGVTRKQQMLVSEQEVEQASAQAYQQQLSEAKNKGALNTDSKLTARVRNISQRLVPQTATFRPDAPGWQWEFNTLKTDELNAYCMPGGKIMVYSGLVDKLNLTDAELAAVIGHEIGHALREHSRERISRQYAQQVALTGAAVLTGAGEALQGLAGQVANVTFQLPHSREQESEADRIGLELMARAGYDPNAAVSVWKKMMAQEQSGQPQFLSTHPSPSSRIQDLQALAPKVMPLYQKAAKT
jgi:predicted Zn-dependent protease